MEHISWQKVRMGSWRALRTQFREVTSLQIWMIWTITEQTQTRTILEFMSSCDFFKEGNRKKWNQENANQRNKHVIVETNTETEFGLFFLDRGYLRVTNQLTKRFYRNNVANKWKNWNINTLQTLKNNSNGSKQKLPMLLISQNENQQPGCMCLLSEPHNSTQRHCCQRIKPETNQDA